MKVLILSRSLPCHQLGGLEKYTMLLAQGLAARMDVETHILTTAHPKGYSELSEGNLHIHFIPNNNPGKYSLDTFRLFHIYTSELDKTYKFDVIHSQGFAGCLLIKKKNQKIILSPHGTLFSETALEKKYFATLTKTEKIKAIWQSKSRLAFIPSYKRLLNIADVIHADSNFIREYLISKYPVLESKISVIPLGIPPDKYPASDKIAAQKKLSANNTKTIFFSLGRHTKLKGFDLILKAAAMLRSDDYEVWIGGEGTMTGQYMRFAEENKISQIKFLGRIPENDIYDYYAAADYFIIPDISCPAFGLVALESLIQNTKVIASDSGALPEIVSLEFGRIFKRNDFDHLAKIMSEAIDDKNISRKNLAPYPGEKPSLRQSVIQKFSFEKMIDDILKIYR